MATLSEDYIAQTVDPLQLGVGEAVLVVTKMGAPVATGYVSGNFPPWAVQVKEGGDKGGSILMQVYDTSLYSFVPLTPDANVVDDSDVAILAKTVMSEKAEPKEEKPKAAKKPAKAKAKANGNIRDNEKSSSTKVDVDKLPADLKKKIVGVDELDEEQINRVVSDISDAALRSLKNVGVRDLDVYARVLAIQKSVNTVLGGGK